MKTDVYRLALIFLFAASHAAGKDDSGLKISGAGDIVGSYGFGETGESKRHLQAREAEIMLFAPIDHQFDGIISAAAHEEAGSVNFEIHELNLSTSKLIPRTRLKLGQYFLGVGRLNRRHRHDWPFISAPKMHEEFFAEEAVIDSGLEIGYLTPLPFYLDITFGMTSGYTFGHTHSAGQRPLIPTHYLRPATFFELSDQAGLEFALNYLARRDRDGTDLTLLGTDIVGKWRSGKTIRWLVQTETWWRRQASAATTRELGSYIYWQYGFSPNWAFGTRADYYTILSLGQKNADYSFVPTLTYSSSEFARFRLAYRHELQTLAGTQAQLTPFVEFQATFLLGAHPAHEF